MLKRSLFLAAALVLGFVGFTGWALEASGVAVVVTNAADGTKRSTRVWYVESDGELWLEAGTPENAWFVDISRDPQLALQVEGQSRTYVAMQVPQPAVRDRLRSSLREKYGLRDRWIGILFDTSRSVPVRLTPLPAREGSPRSLDR
jgi:hypothetical protein